MIVLSDSNNNIVGSYLDGTTVTNLTGVTSLPTLPEQQVGVNAVLIIDPATKELSYRYVAMGATLADVQTSKIAQITDLYNQKLSDGFTSNSTGSSHIFGYATSDQTKFMQLAILVLNNMAVWPVNIPAKDNTTVPHTQAQYQQLVMDIANFAQSQNTKQHDYINQVNSCSTIDQVNAIVVTF